MVKVNIPKVKKDKDLVEVKPGDFPQIGEEAMKTMTDSAEIFQLMEARDEQQMMKAIMGVYSKEYIYDIPFKGGKVYACKTPGCKLAIRKEPHTHVRGLSWTGIKEARRIFKAIDTQKVSPPAVVEHDGKQYYECAATAVDLRTGNSTTVFKRQPLMKQKKSGEYIEDPFAFEIVQSKAKRNAIAEILPQPLIRGWIQDWLGGKKDFDPKRVIDLHEAEDYSVEKEKPKQHEPRPEVTPGEKMASPPQLNKIYAAFRDIEELGGRTFDASLADWKKYFGVDSFKALTLVQASKIIKTNISNVSKLQNVAQLNKERTERESQEAKKEPQEGLLREKPPAPDRDKILRLIKDALAEQHWDIEDESFAKTLLSPYNLKSVKELEAADISVLQKVLNDVGGGGEKKPNGGTIESEGT